MEKRFGKAMLAGMAGGMVAWWAAKRFYVLARRSSETASLGPYLAGAALGAAYGAVALRRGVPLLARVPLSAALYLREPETVPEGGNVAARMASGGLKKAAERALFA